MRQLFELFNNFLAGKLFVSKAACFYYKALIISHMYFFLLSVNVSNRHLLILPHSFNAGLGFIIPTLREGWFETNIRLGVGVKQI
jgi:hypothetical protein